MTKVKTDINGLCLTLVSPIDRHSNVFGFKLYTFHDYALFIAYTMHVLILLFVFCNFFLMVSTKVLIV